MQFVYAVLYAGALLLSLNLCTDEMRSETLILLGYSRFNYITALVKCVYTSIQT